MRRKFSCFKLLALIVLFISVNASIIAQPPPPPPPPSGGHGIAGNQHTGKAPVGEGVIFLIGFASLYAARKVYVHKKEVSVE